MQGTLVFLFFIGMVGDAFTTFLGILEILGTKIGNVNFNDPGYALAQLGNVNDPGNYAFAMIGTSVITGLNILTTDVFARKEKIIFLFWLPAIIVDFIASLTGSLTFIKPGANPFLAYGLVFFVTIFITVSPAMLRYIMKRPID